MGIVFILLAVTLLLHLLLTCGSIMVWRNIKQNSPELMAKVFFTTSIVRIIASVGVFAASLFLIKDNMDYVKFFTVLFLIIYMLLLVFDTAYFYFSVKSINSTKADGNASAKAGNNASVKA